MVRGNLPHKIKHFHEKYGDIVRVAPDELSFIRPDAWRDIYSKGREFVRPDEYKDQPPGKTAANLIACSETEHARLRKILAPGFSEKYAMEQEPFIQSYVDKLCEKLDDRLQNDKISTVDVVEWINYLAFDVIGDLTWGSSFGCLDGLTYHPWVQTVGQFKAAIVVGALKFYPPIYSFLMAITPPSALQAVMDMWKLTEQNVRERVAGGASRPDIVGTMMASESMTQEEMEVNSMMIVAAGSESITTVLTGVISHLLRTPDKLNTLVQILRTTFLSEQEITGSALKSLPYLDAVLNEGMRLCPTIPDGMRRNVPVGGATIAGQIIPGGMVVSIPPFTTYRASRNFTHAEEFAPERWLGEDVQSSKFQGDSKTAFNPFSLGAHNCPGQNLAWLELRIILVRLLWRYNLSIPPGVELPQWEDQGIWWFWDKQPTMVRFQKFR
ncbi:cytochrome P450 [Penicillium frequentans]|uniref:Cytochrome P450 n=1 Tax=Penicillium frequentans TaxID=3151616 RepID=A0AAD6CR34_9EURO|nr:cytochrome P450 [Penicillium glabrum]